MTCTCGKSWTGMSMAHCPACHETFSTVSNFDIHRVGSVDNRECANPSLKGLVQNDRGTWKGVDERDVTEWLHK